MPRWSVDLIRARSTGGSSQPMRRNARSAIRTTMRA